MTEDDQQARACAEHMYAADQASQSLGMQIEKVGAGFARLTMKVRPDMVNGHKLCHGGVIFTLADSAFAIACNSYNLCTVAASAEVSFLKSAFEGEILTADARERWREGRNGIYDISVANGDGVVIAEFRGKSRTIQGAVLENEENTP
ncbi:MAG: hydroxyphenylacetyl-CoA thioesterase PaaI [Alphaproteobacteria bacterium]|nr:hydroxyphenylacetyl-CoA thioesterase PaaI [Alphaproteobacteria bacterium]